MVSRKNTSSHLPLAILISDFNPLSFAFLQLLENNSCRVTVVSEDINSWEEAFRKSSVEKLTTSIIKKSEVDFSEVNYLICLHYPSVDDACENDFSALQKKINLTKDYAIRFKSKTLFIFPFLQSLETHSFLSAQVNKIISNKKIYSGIVYLGDVINLQKVSRKNFRLETFLEKSVATKTLTAFSSGQLFYPIPLELTAGKILKCLYSLSAYGKKTAIISNPISAERILSVLKSAYPENGFSFVNGAKKTTQADVDETEFVDEDGVGLIKNKVEIIWERMGGKKDLDGDTLVFPKIPLNTCRADKESVFLKAVDKKGKYLKVPLLPFRSLKKWRAKIVTIFLLVFLLPALMLMASVVFFLLGKRAFMAGNVKVAKPIFNTILVIANVTARYSDCLSEIPMAGIIYQQVEDSAEILKKTSEIGLGGIDIVNNLLNLSESVVQKGDYDLTNQSRKIFFGLELLYKQLGFLQAEMRYLEFLPEKIAGVILGDIDVVSVREKVLYIQKLAEELPALLGENKKVSYMILFQNNTILRSTGGSIETFGLVSFDDGKFEGLEIFDSSQVDRNLQGAVDPPSPIKKYFNETKWYLRDSNRSSDFPTSAAKAEWFLDKGMGRAVDGVIALDLEFIKLILDKVGGINLENTNVMMDKDNVYEIVGSFSQDDNYPKLDKESSYTNFVRAVFAKSANLGDLGKVKFLQSVLNSLNQKNIQLFSHGKNTQRALAELNWDGAVRRAVCQNNCYSDFIGLTEVNVGGGNSNLIAGELELSVSLEEGLIKRKLIVFLENPTDDFYKAYFQVLTNADSGFGQVETVGTEFKESLTPEVYAAKGYKEAGVLVEILPKETKAIIFNWESGSELNFSEEGEYALFWRKQAGAVARLIDINIYVPESVEIKDSQDFGLTNEGSYGYNTKLLKDFSTNILW